MNIKSLLISIIPPILTQWLENRKANYSIYGSYDEALASCKKSKGYEEDELLEVVLIKTQRLKNELAQKSRAEITENDALALLAIERLAHTGSVNIIDYGGACGAHYFQMAVFFNRVAQVNWRVVESPGMANKAQALAIENKLSFSHDLGVAIVEHQAKIIFSSGTLQCVPDAWLALEQIINSGAKYIILNRIALHDGPGDFVIKHHSKLSWNGVGPLPEGFTDKVMDYPYTLLEAKKFGETMAKRYTEIARVNDRSGFFKINGKKLIGYSALYELQQ